MVIIKRAYGQLANKLHFFAHFVANAIEHKYLLIHTDFPEFHDLFEPNHTQKVAVIIQKGGFVRKTTNKILNQLHSISERFNLKIPKIIFHAATDHENNKIDFDTNGEEFVKLTKRKVVLPQGWVYRDHVNFERYQTEIRAFFSLKQEFANEVTADINLARGMGDLVIGIHIRRGDYKDFNGGKWFYGNEVYKQLMHDAELLFPDKKCVFIICSNDEIAESQFSEFRTLIRQRSAIVDLYLLAECDYLFGPPSTYTEWASFLKNVPMYYVREPDKKIEIECFNRYFK